MSGAGSERYVEVTEVSKIYRNGTADAVTWWRTCCAAMFGFAAPPPADVSDQTVYNTAILPLLWPPY